MQAIVPTVVELNFLVSAARDMQDDFVDDLRIDTFDQGEIDIF